MKGQFILDTGPLVAWLCPKDGHHLWARQVFATLPAGCLICEAVLAEACHLAARDGIARSKVLEFVERGRLTPVFLGAELPLIRNLLNQYADVGMDFADACLVRLAEIHADITLCTTDRDFQFYRCNGQQSLRLVAPFIC